MSITQKSERASFDADGFQNVKDDVASLCRVVNNASPVITSAWQSVLCGATGTASIYASAAAASTGSNGSNYWSITALRNGRQLDTPLVIRTDVREVELYKYVCLGQSKVALGDVIEISVAQVGSPISTILASHWTLLISIQVNQ